MPQSLVQAFQCRTLSLSSSTQQVSSLLAAYSQRDAVGRAVSSRTLRVSL